MDTLKENALRNKFKAILFDLAKSQDTLQSEEYRKNVYIQLEEMYHSHSAYSKEKFRHYYSDIFIVLTVIKGDSSLGDIDTLGANLSILYENCIPMNKDENNQLIDIRDELKKLYDHVSLDIARIRYSDKGDWELSKDENFKKLKTGMELAEQTIKKLEDELKESQDKISYINQQNEQLTKEIEDSQNELRKSMESVKVDYITILGLFSGIIITFVAGLVFSGSVLENMHNGSIYRVSLVVLIIALFIFNLVFSCYHFIEKIASRNSTNKNSLTLQPWIWTNVIIICLIFGVCICFFNNIV